MSQLSDETTTLSLASGRVSVYVFGTVCLEAKRFFLLILFVCLFFLANEIVWCLQILFLFSSQVTNAFVFCSTIHQQTLFVRLFCAASKIQAAVAAAWRTVSTVSERLSIATVRLSSLVI